MYISVSGDNAVHQPKLGVRFVGWMVGYDCGETGEQPEQRQGEYHSTLLLPWYGTRAERYKAEETPDESWKGVSKGAHFPAAASKYPGDDGLDVGVDN